MNWFEKLKVKTAGRYGWSTGQGRRGWQVPQGGALPPTMPPDPPTTSNIQRTKSFKDFEKYKNWILQQKNSSFGPLMLPSTSIAQKAKVFLNKDFQTFWKYKNGKLFKCFLSFLVFWYCYRQLPTLKIKPTKISKCKIKKVTTSLKIHHCISKQNIGKA